MASFVPPDTPVDLGTQSSTAEAPFAPPDSAVDFTPTTSTMPADAPTVGGTLAHVVYGALKAPADTVAGIANAEDIGRKSGVTNPMLALYAGMAEPVVNAILGRNTPAPTAGDTFKKSLGPANVDQYLPAPQNPQERIAEMGGEGIATAVAPELLAGKGATLANIARAGFTGLASGVGGQSAVEAAPERLKPLAGLAGSIAGGAAGEGAAMATSAGARGLMDTVGPAIPSLGPINRGTPIKDAEGNIIARPTALQEQAVANNIANAATDRDAALAGATPTGETGVPLTTAQAADDLGLYSLERKVATNNPEPFIMRRAEQNDALLNSMEGLPPVDSMSPTDLGEFFRARLQDLDSQTQQALDAAQQHAHAQTTDLGAPNATETGTQAQEAMQKAVDANKAQQQALWSAVPKDTVAVAGPLKRAVGSTYGDLSPVMQDTVTPAEQSIVNRINELGATLPFGDLQDFRSRISAEMRAMQSPLNPNSQAYGRLAQLRGAVEDAISDSIAGKVDQEQQAVAAGTMAPEDTMAAHMERQRQDWYANRNAQTGTNSPEGFGANGTSGSAAIPRPSRATGQAYSGPNGAASNQGIPANAGSGPLIDQQAADALRAASDFTRASKAKLAPLMRFIKRPGPTYPYEVPPEQVASSIWKPGPEGAATVRSVLDGTDHSPEAVEAIKNAAVGSLRAKATSPDGVVDPKKFADWRANHAEALQAVPDLAARMDSAANASEYMQSLASLRREEMDAYQRSEAGKLLKADPGDVVNTIGNLFGKKDTVARVRNLMAEAKSDPAAVGGIQRAVLEFMEQRLKSNTEGATGNQMLKPDMFQTFVKRNKGALNLIFDSDQVKVMEGIANDLQRIQKPNSVARLPNGSSATAQDSRNILETLLRASEGKKLPLGLAGAAYMTGLGPFWTAASGLGSLAFNALRSAGIRNMDQLLVEAMRNPDVGLALLAKGKVRANASIGTRLARALAKSSMLEPQLSQERQGFAAGGSVRGYAVGGAASDAVIDAILAEAGGGGIQGMQAVANVIKNRSEQSGISPAAVVAQPHQFEGYSSPSQGGRDNQSNSLLRQQAADVWAGVMNGDLPDNTGGATHFYADYSAAPSWAKGVQTVDIGGNRFLGNGTPVPVQARPSSQGALASLTMDNQNAIRHEAINPDLAAQLQRAVTSVYGPQYSVDVMSGAQPEGPPGTPGTTGTRRHGTGVAADVVVRDPAGNRLGPQQLQPLAQYWLGSNIGSVGFPADGKNFMHLDLIGGKVPGSVPLQKGEGLSWYYGTPTKDQVAAIDAGKRGVVPSNLYAAPTAVASRMPDTIDPSLLSYGAVPGQAGVVAPMQARSAPVPATRVASAPVPAERPTDLLGYAPPTGVPSAAVQAINEAVPQTTPVENAPIVHQVAEASIPPTPADYLRGINAAYPGLGFNDKAISGIQNGLENAGVYPSTLGNLTIGQMKSLPAATLAGLGDIVSANGVDVSPGHVVGTLGLGKAWSLAGLANQPDLTINQALGIADQKLGVTPPSPTLRSVQLPEPRPAYNPAPASAPTPQVFDAPPQQRMPAADLASIGLPGTPNAPQSGLGIGPASDYLVSKGDEDGILGPISPSLPADFFAPQGGAMSPVGTSHGMMIFTPSAPAPVSAMPHGLDTSAMAGLSGLPGLSVPPGVEIPTLTSVRNAPPAPQPISLGSGVHFDPSTGQFVLGNAAPSLPTVPLAPKPAIAPQVAPVPQTMSPQLAKARTAVQRPTGLFGLLTNPGGFAGILGPTSSNDGLQANGSTQVGSYNDESGWGGLGASGGGNGSMVG